MDVRQYDLMRRVMAGTSFAQQHASQSRQSLQRVDTPFKPGTDPKNLALAILLDAMHHGKPQTAYWDAKVAADMAEGNRHYEPPPDGLPTAVMSDIVRSSAVVHVEGDANAWRIELDMNGKHLILYAARDRGIPKVIGAPYMLRGVGAHVLRLSGKHADAAARLLDWVEQDVHGRHDLGKLWGSSRDATAITLAGTLLLADPARDVSAGTKCGATTDDGKLACDHMVAHGDRELHKWSDLLAFATAWETRDPARLDPVYEHVIALFHLGRTADAEHVLDAALAKHPDDAELLGLRAEAGIGHVSANELIDRLDAIVRVKPTDGYSLNNVAWMKLTAGVDLAGARYDAEKSVEDEPDYRNAANTLAAIRAESGDLREAVVEIHRATELSREDSPPPADWYVLGRIYELAGLRDDAIAAYRRLPRSDDDDPVLDVARLAAARLTALGVKR
jgi:tetratricopeptide (TPR) repeat protein